MEREVQKQMDSQNKQQKELTYLQLFVREGESKLRLHQNYVFLKVLLGKYLVQAYRVFKMIPSDNTMILFKRQHSQTHYNFLLIINNLAQLRSNAQTLGSQENVIRSMKNKIQKMIKRPLQNYSIAIALIEEMKKLIFPTLEQWMTFIGYLKNQQYNQSISKLMNPQSEGNNGKVGVIAKVECFVPTLTKENEDILFEAKQQIEDLKELISTYIDTFANQQKGNLIYKLIQKSSVSFSIDILLNTINFIIFEQMQGTCYNQIQPCNWTCYEASKKSLESDRKHIVLSGCGQICVLQIIFMRQIESQNKTEYLMMMGEFKKFYKKAKIKIIRLTNEKWNGSIEKINLEGGENEPCLSPFMIYKFHSTTACDYSNQQQK